VSLEKDIRHLYSNNTFLVGGNVPSSFIGKLANNSGIHHELIHFSQYLKNPQISNSGISGAIAETAATILGSPGITTVALVGVGAGAIVNSCV